jgi:ligand-binding sensor domain-containing protein
MITIPGVLFFTPMLVTKGKGIGSFSLIPNNSQPSIPSKCANFHIIEGIPAIAFTRNMHLMKTALPRYFLSLALLLAALTGHAQYYRLQNYNIKDGLPTSEEYGVMQDSRGYIWTIGDLGVSRFDGYTFKNFSTENGLPDNTIFALSEDKKGRIWFCSLSGKLSYYKDGGINVLPCNAELTKQVQYGITNSIYVDEGDTIWLGMDRNYLVKIKPGWTAEDVQRIEMAAGKYIFIAGKEGIIFGGNSPLDLPVHVYNNRGKKIQSLDPGVANLEKLSVRFFAMRTSSGAYLASVGKVLFRFTSAGITDRAEENGVVISMLEDKDGSIITASMNGLSIRSEADLHVIKRISQLNSKVITGLCIDHENSLWITSEGHGLYCLPHRNFSYYTPGDGLSESKISCMDHYKDMMLTGHLDGTVSLFNNDSISTVPGNNNDSTAQHSVVTSIFNHDSKTYIIRSKNIYVLEKGGLKEIPGPRHINRKKAIVSRNGDIWCIVFKNICKYGPEFGSIKQEITLPTRAENIFEDSEGVLWLSTIDGVYTYDGKTLANLAARDSLLAYRTVDICEGPDHSIWIATRGGGIIVRTGNTFTHLTEKDGLAGNMCRCLFLDSNTVWVGTNRGLSRITVTPGGKFLFDNYYSRNGLLSNEIGSIASHEGKLWLAHNNGITIFDPRNTRSNTSPPPVYITDLLVNDHTFDINAHPGLHYDQNHITINYTGLSYKDAGNIEYKYKMSGVDSAWINTRYTSVEYHTLPPGSYRFEVLAKNNDGYWSSSPSVISFTIYPPWWQTWIFRVGAALVLLTLTILIFKIRLERIRKQDREKAQLQYLLSETELKALRAQMNPHFIFNAINSVQYFITSHDAASSQKYLAKFARLIRYVVENSRPASILLKTEIEALGLYLELESLRFEEQFAYTINIQKNVDVNYTHVPTMIIQPYVENAIWHGLMPKKGKGTLSIDLEMQDEVLKCTIMDNGIGRKKSQEMKLKNGSTLHKSVGMSNIRERLDIINRVNNINMDVKILDLTDDKGEPAGTCVELTIPIY